MTLILPWIFSLIISLVLPICHILLSRRRHHHYYPGQQQQQYEQWSSRRTKKRLEELLLRVQNFEKVLDRDDFITQNNSNIDVQQDDYDTMLSIPYPGRSVDDLTQQQHGRRSVSGSCAICLMKYNENDIVVWSSNSNCPHVFHENCIVSWFSKKRHYFLCPCCRQDFFGGKNKEDGVSNANVCS